MMYVYNGQFNAYDAFMGIIEAQKTCKALYGRLWRIYDSYRYDRGDSI